MIRKLPGKTKSPSYNHLNHTGAETKSTSKFDIAETLGETFLNNSCSKIFKKQKKNKKKIKLNFKSSNSCALMKILMFSTHLMKYIWYLLKKVNFLFILYFLEDLQLINLLTIKPNHNNVKGDKGVFVTEYLDQST